MQIDTNHEHTMRSSQIISAAILPALSITAVSDPGTDEWSRKGKTELYGFGEYLTGADASYSNGDMSLDFDDGLGGGVGVGYNFSDHFNLNTDLGFAQMDLAGSGFGNTVSGDTTTFTWNLNVDYNILKRRLTPFITAGAGIATFNGDIEGNDFNETSFSYGVGGGLRWDFSDRWYVKAGYRAMWTSLEDADDATMFSIVAISVGYKF